MMVATGAFLAPMNATFAATCIIVSGCAPSGVGPTGRSADAAAESTTRADDAAIAPDAPDATAAADSMADFDSANEAASAPNDGSTVEAETDAPSGGALADVADSSAGPAWCVANSPCSPPSNQCNLGVLTCNPPGCVDTGMAAPDGTPCSSGTCQAGACSEACSGPFNMSASDCSPKPCLLGSCNATSAPSVGSCVVVPELQNQPEPTGTSCGTSQYQLCLSGSCIVAQCVTNAQCAPGEECSGYQCLSSPPL